MLGVWRLQLLREVAHRGTMRAAGEALNVTPSAVSQQLAILEREAGIALVERHGRRVQMTEAGMRLIEHADVITDAIVAAEADMATMRRSVTGQLRIAAFPTAARAIMPAVMTALSQRHPALRLTLRDLETAESLDALETDDVDVAVIDDYEEATPLTNARFDSRELMRDPLYLALPPGLSTPTPARLADFKNAYWIMDAEGSHLFDAAVRACRTSGFDPHVRSNCKDFSVLMALVEAGLGVGVVPGLALVDRPLRATVCPLSPPLQRRILVVVRSARRSHPAVASALTEFDLYSRERVPREQPEDTAHVDVRTRPGGELPMGAGGSALPRGGRKPGFDHAARP